MKYHFTFIFLFSTLLVGAQRLDYSRFELKNGWTCDQKMDTLRLRQTAAAYFFQSRYVEAQPVFDCMLTRGMKFNKEELYQYALCTQTLGLSEKANEIFNHFSILYPKDIRALNYQKKYPFNQQIEVLTCESWAFNTVYSDYGVRFFNGQIVWCSNQPLFSGQQIDHWDGFQFSNLFTLGVQDGKPQILPMRQLNGYFHESTSCLSPDGQILYYTKNKALQTLSSNGVLGLEIRRAKLVNGEWKDIGSLQINGFETVNFAHPALSPDGKFLYFVADAQGGLGQSDIWYIDLNQKPPFIAVHAGNEINTSGRESFPFFGADGTMYFASDGHYGLGGLDIYAKQIVDDKVTISHFEAPINSKYDDFSFSLDANQQKAYLSSNRVGGRGNDDIYELKLNFKSLDINQTSIDTIRHELDSTNELHVESQVTAESQVANDSIQKSKNQETVPLIESVFELPVLYFELNSSDLTKESISALNELAAYLNVHPELKLQINAHADCRGSAAYNLSLSQKRAAACKDYLAALLQVKTSLLAVGYGETQLTNNCNCTDAQVTCSEIEHGQNRRIEFIWK